MYIYQCPYPPARDPRGRRYTYYYNIWLSTITLLSTILTEVVYMDYIIVWSYTDVEIGT